MLLRCLGSYLAPANLDFAISQLSRIHLELLFGDLLEPNHF